MVLFIDTGSKRLSFRISTPEDMEPIFQMFPAAEHDVAFAADLEEAVSIVADYLSNHHMDAWIEGDGLHKGLKEAALGAAMLASVVPTKMSMEPAPKPAAHVRVQQPGFGKKPEDHFLWAIQQIESTGGKNTNHKQITAGSMKGQTAMGRWGLLKPTVMDVLARHQTYQKGKLEEHLKPLLGMDRDQMDGYFKQNPDAEMHVARLLAKYVMNKQKGDLDRSAYSWLHGHYRTPESIQQASLDTDDYVGKFRHLMASNVAKAEGKFELEEPTFKERLKAWGEKHDAVARQATESDWAADLGRKHDDSKEGPRGDKKRTLATIKDLAQAARQRQAKP